MSDSTKNQRKEWKSNGYKSAQLTSFLYFDNDVYAGL